MITLTIDEEQLARVIKAAVREALAEQKKEPVNSIQWFSLSTLREYLPDKPGSQTIYHWVHKGEIPYHKRGKRLLFLKSDIDEWMKKGRIKTQAELEQEATNYVMTHKRRR